MPPSLAAAPEHPSGVHATQARDTARPRPVALWLFAVAALVFAIVVVGGITRLTESGLSIVRWEPVTGIVPPLTEAEWQAEFDAYKAYPEYQKINRGMTLDQFKQIYFWEYLHRLLGRLIGLAFAVPLAIFAWRRAIPPGLGPRLFLLLGLGALQGAIGWWMVASGLVDRPDVAPERLAVHLLLALLIFAVLIWTGLDALRAEQPAASPRYAPTGWIAPLFVLLTLQIALGAFTAGLDAGYAFNTWPKMGDWWVPPGLDMRPLLHNPIAVQFAHRTLAFAVALLTLYAAWRLWRAGGAGLALALAGAVVLQFTLGVLTLVHGVPITLAVLHQAGAALLLAAAVVAAHWAAAGRRPIAVARNAG